MEAVQLVKGGQSPFLTATAKVLGILTTSLHSWIKLSAKGQLKDAGDKPVSQLQMELARLGNQYCGQEFQSTLADYKMRSSMSRKGNCWNNAPTESLWGSFEGGQAVWAKI
jgi:hypothetical protein